MSTIDDLKARARSTPLSASCEDLHVQSGGARHPNLVTNATEAYFGADDTRQEVRLIIDGDVIGYLSREDILDLVDFKSMGIGRHPGGTTTFPPPPPDSSTSKKP